MKPSCFLLTLLGAECLLVSGAPPPRAEGPAKVVFESQYGGVTELDLKAFQLLGASLHLRHVRLRGNEENLDAKLIAADRCLAASCTTLDYRRQKDLVRHIAPYAVGSWVVQDLLKEAVEISDQDARAYYEANLNRARRPPRATVHHLFVEIPPEAAEEDIRTAHGKIEGALKAYETGTPFEQVCRQYSEDPGAADCALIKDLPQGTIAPELDSAIFALKEGQHSDVVRTRTGLHVFYLTEITAGEKPSFQEVEFDIKEHLREKKAFEAWQSLWMSAEKQPVETLLAGIDWSTPDRVLEIEGERFDQEALQLLGVILAGAPQFSPRTANETLIRLRRALTASRKPLFQQLLDDPLYEASVNLVLHWHLAKEYCKRVADQAGTPSEEELRAYYEQHLGGYMTQPERRASMIFLPVALSPESTPADRHYAFEERLKQAKRIVAEVEGGRPFAELAKAHSAAASGKNGGYLGWVREPSFYEADTTLARLNPGEVSQPVESRDGYYIFQLHETKPPKPGAFEALRSEVKTDLVWSRTVATWDRLLLEAEEQAQLSPKTLP